MARGRGHRGNLMEIGTELNIVPYLDMMTVLVLFLLVNITSFLSFTILNASIPQLVPDSANVQPPPKTQKEQLLLIVRVMPKGFIIDPSVQGGASIDRREFAKVGDAYDFEKLRELSVNLKARFQDESKVLIIADPKIIYDDIIHTMDALREQTDGAGDLFPDVTLSII